MRWQQKCILKTQKQTHTKAEEQHSLIDTPMLIIYAFFFSFSGKMLIDCFSPSTLIVINRQKTVSDKQTTKCERFVFTTLQRHISYTRKAIKIRPMTVKSVYTQLTTHFELLFDHFLRLKLFFFSYTNKKWI